MRTITLSRRVRAYKSFSWRPEISPKIGNRIAAAGREPARVPKRAGERAAHIPQISFLKTK
jgi:hypothetical protein